MGTKYNPRIVTNDLVLCLDAANYRSYSGSGTTWYDLSSYNNTSELINGPTYSTYNLGYLVFDGTNDYINVNSLANILSYSEYTKIAFFYVTSFSSNNNIISGGFSGQHAFSLQGSNTLKAGHNGYWATVSGNTELSINTWYFAAVTYSNSTGWKLYLNGIEDGTSNDTTTFTGNQEIVIGAAGTGDNLSGGIGLVQVYNRSLTSQEILQNYNAAKGRYLAGINAIVLDGLTLYLDAANNLSYPGSGTTWYDLSSSNNTSELINGPTYSSSNEGCLVFDGADDYVNVNSFANILSYSEYTKIAFFYVTSFSYTNNIISGGFSGAHAFWLAASDRLYSGHNGQWNTVVGNTTLSLNTWYFGAVTYSNSTGWKLYLNGIEDGTSADTTTFGGGQEILVGAYGGGNNFSGQIGLVQVYSRALTAAEILQNYNATKRRFGL